MQILKQTKQRIEDKVKVVRRVHQDPYTFVEISLNGCTAYGFSKRNPIDEPDEKLGFQIAYGRALHQLALRSIKISYHTDNHTPSLESAQGGIDNALRTIAMVVI